MPDPFASNRILLIDDNLESAELLQMLLDLDDYESRIAANGRDALAIASTFDPHVVITDIMMPDMNGIEVARQFRQSTQSRHVLLIAVSGWSDDQKFEDTDGMFDFRFSKPLDFDTLRNCMRNFFGAHRGSSPCS